MRRAIRERGRPSPSTPPPGAPAPTTLNQGATPPVWSTGTSDKIRSLRRRWRIPVVIALALTVLTSISWLLIEEIPLFEGLLIFIPLAVVGSALSIARAIEGWTTPKLKRALEAIEVEESEEASWSPAIARVQQTLSANDAWSKELHRLRSDYLLDVRAHAERWRTIFGSLLAVFGVIVLVGRPQTLSAAGQTLDLLILLTVLGLSAGLTAIAMAGWAAAAAPKIDWLMQNDPKVLRKRIFIHANRSAARLRAALTCGVVALVAVLAGTVGVLLGGRG
jgi:hypothetical protein